jgi:hypothetical protein
MNLPIKFPDDSDVIAEEAARFRALTPGARIRSIRGMIDAGVTMMQLSPKAAYLREFVLEHEKESQNSIRVFLSRHAI